MNGKNTSRNQADKKGLHSVTSFGVTFEIIFQALLIFSIFQAAVSKAEELVLLHQEYQRGLHMFEDWLEQEQSSLALLSPLDEDVNALENTLKELQVIITVIFSEFNIVGKNIQHYLIFNFYSFCLTT